MNFKSLYEASKAQESIKSKEDVLKWLAMHNAHSKDKPQNLTQYEEENYEIEDDLTINLINSISKFVLDARTFKGTELPVKFGKCEGQFSVRDTTINSFKNFPTHWGHESTLHIDGSAITSFRGMPLFTGTRVVLSDIDIESFEGFNVNAEVADIRATTLPELTSLKGLPDELGACHLHLGSEKLTSLDGLPKASLSALTLKGCRELKSLAGIATYCPNLQMIAFNKTHIESNVLGLLKMKKLGAIRAEDCTTEFKNAVAIITRHKQADEIDVAECVDELMDAGLKAYAKT
jgi:hypothetical protein